MNTSITRQELLRQAFQSIVQFLTVFFTGMLVYDKVPTSLDQLWQPFVQGMLAALIIWGGSKMSVGPNQISATEGEKVILNQLRSGEIKVVSTNGAY